MRAIIWVVTLGLAMLMLADVVASIVTQLAARKFIKSWLEANAVAYVEKVNLEKKKDKKSKTADMKADDVLFTNIEAGVATKNILGSNGAKNANELPKTAYKTTVDLSAFAAQYSPLKLYEAKDQESFNDCAQHMLETIPILPSTITAFVGEIEKKYVKRNGEKDAMCDY